MSTPLDAGRKALGDLKERANKWQNMIDKVIKTEAGVSKSIDGLPSSTPSDLLGADGDPVSQQVPQVSKSVFKMLDERIKKSEVMTMNKTVFRVLEKSETFINLKDPANTDTKKSYKTVGKPDDNLPGDYEPKKIEAEGSGGEMKKDEEPASASPTAPAKPPNQTPSTALKPHGVPGDKVGDAPSIPKPPAAPGHKGTTMKSESGVFAKLKKSKQ